ncbi:DUF1385 domain-containing protein [Candidatus Woesearchaeota archaeon]|nr:DUF1385 domain-containing protein [Candidatus Woesearchaeota archaeon]
MKPIIGGQAVIDGVMMKGPRHYAISIKKTNGNIKTKTESLNNRHFKPFKWPIIRGFVNLVDMLILGLKSLQWSANEQDNTNEEIGWKEYAFLLATSLGFAIGLFIIFPLFLTKLITNSKGLAFNVIEGLLRILIFVIYLLIIGLMKDIQILFQYHGAEHKAVNCYEAGEKLTLKNAEKFTTSHPRCGTSFILIVLILSIVLFSVITSELWLVKFLVRIFFIPLIAGISYEILHYSTKNKSNPILNMCITPGLYLQRLTTREPTKIQLEVALESLTSVLDKTLKSV